MGDALLSLIIKPISGITRKLKLLSSQLNKLALKLIEYDFEIKHKLGSAMRVPDSLS